jgi:hypothetical protein
MRGVIQLLLSTLCKYNPEQKRDQSQPLKAFTWIVARIVEGLDFEKSIPPGTWKGHSVMIKFDTTTRILSLGLRSHTNGKPNEKA